MGSGAAVRVTAQKPVKPGGQDPTCLEGSRATTTPPGHGLSIAQRGWGCKIALPFGAVAGCGPWQPFAAARVCQVALFDLGSRAKRLRQSVRGQNGPLGGYCHVSAAPSGPGERSEDPNLAPKLTHPLPGAPRGRNRADRPPGRRPEVLHRRSAGEKDVSGDCPDPCQVDQGVR